MTVIVMVTIFFLCNLKKDVNRIEYEKWIREVDYPRMKKYLESIKSYITYRIGEEDRKKIQFDYLEHVEITSMENYKRDMETPEFKKLTDEWLKFVEDAIEIHAEPIR